MMVKLFDQYYACMAAIVEYELKKRKALFPWKKRDYEKKKEIAMDLLNEYHGDLQRMDEDKFNYFMEKARGQNNE